MSFGGFLLYIESESLVLYPLAVNLAVSALGAWRVCNGAMFLLEGGGNGLGMESGRVCSRSRSEVSGVRVGVRLDGPVPLKDIGGLCPRRRSSPTVLRPSLCFAPNPTPPRSFLSFMFPRTTPTLNHSMSIWMIM
ncbi:hypothetical protein JHK86_023638 [Glycine max]|nr:hypothetical protein JHK86_023638 [Glycine max]